MAPVAPDFYRAEVSFFRQDIGGNEIEAVPVERILQLPVNGCPGRRLFRIRENPVQGHFRIFHEIIKAVAFHEFHQGAAGKEDTPVVRPVYRHGTGHFISDIREVEAQLGAGIFQPELRIKFLPPGFAVQFGAIEGIIRLDAEAAIVFVMLRIAGQAQGGRKPDFLSLIGKR